MATQEILRLENIHKWVGEGDSRIDILGGITLTLHAGEFVAVMGASGSGKSTLLNLIGLLDLPSAGTLKLLGQDVSQLGGNDLARLRSRSIGFIFQTFNLLPYLSVRGNVELPMEYAGRTDFRARSGMLLSKMSLSHRTDAHPVTLSGGEKQRVAIARALSNEPALLLADEPTGALDSKTGRQIMDLISELNRGGAAVILVTHDEAIAKRAQRVIRMRDGRFE
jgi:putative ABC transport system ATP-binding protein